MRNMPRTARRYGVDGEVGQVHLRRATRQVHAHHPDYSKPLDVVWLCHKDHMREHMAERERRAQK